MSFQPTQRRLIELVKAPSVVVLLIAAEKLITSYNNDECHKQFLHQIFTP